MSKMWKSGLIAMLIVVLAVSMAACSSNNGGTPAQPPAQQGDNGANGDGAGAGAQPGGPGWQADTSPVTFDWYLNFSWFPHKWGVDATSQYITRKTGVDVNFIVPAGNENEKLNTMIASGKLPDFLTIGWWEDGVKSMIEGGLVLPIDELAEQYDPYFFEVADGAKLSWYTQPDGHVYGYPNASSSPKDFERFGEHYASNQTFVVRKDMYEALGKPDMRTPEGFLNALAAAKEMFPSVNGQPLIPLGFHEFTDSGNASFEQYFHNFLALPYDNNGKFYGLFERAVDPEMVSWLKTLRQANEQGLLSKDIFIDKRPQMEEKIAQGRYFAMLYQRTDFAAQQNALFANDPNSVYIAVDGPANSKLETPTLAGPSISGWTVTLISKDVKDKERAIQFMSYLLSEEGQKDMYLGEKGVTYDTIDGKDQFKPDVLELLNTDRSAFDQQYGASHTFWMLMDTIMQLQWQPAAVEPFKQMEEWTYGKTKSFSQFDLIDPPNNSDEGIALGAIKQAWGQSLPKMLLAGSEEEFDKELQSFIKTRDEKGYAAVLDYQQVKYEENVAKLAEFLK